MMTLGAMSLMLTLILSINRSFAWSEQTMMKGKCGLTAVSLASGIIEQASEMYYDQKSITAADTSTSQLTAPASLGPESGESYGSTTAPFNDFDDFNGLTLKDYNELPDTFYVSCTVVYVTATTPNTTSTTATWEKKLTVKVTSKMLVDTVKMSYIYSYWYFR